MTFLRNHAFIVSQLFGLTSLLLNVVRFTRKSRKSVLLWGPPTSATSVVSQFLDAQTQGAAMSVVSMLMALVQAQLGRADHAWLRRLLMVLAGVTGVLLAPPTLSNLPSFLPVIFFVVTRLGESMGTELRLRSVWLVGSMLRIVYFAWYANFMLVTSEMIVLVLSVRRMMALLHAQPAALARSA